QHSGPGFAAKAGVRIDVVAHLDRVDRERLAKALVTGLHGVTALQSLADVRLVCRDDQVEAGCLQIAQGLGDSGQDFQLVERGGRIGAAIANDDAIENAVPIQENRPYVAVSLQASSLPSLPTCSRGV